MPTRRRKTRQWGEIRDWLNVAAALGALLIGIVSLWTTAQISGLEDYLRSEITRRNTDLNAVAARSSMLERTAEARAERLATIQASLDNLLSSSLRVQQDLIGSQGELASVRAQVGEARGALSAARAEATTVRGLFTTQAREFEILRRQQAYEYATIQLAFSTVREDFHDISLGQRLRDSLVNLRAPRRQQWLAPYLSKVSRLVDQVCPDLQRKQLNLSPKPVLPEAPEVNYPRNASSARIIELRNEAMDRWGLDIKKYSEANDAYYRRLQQERERLTVVANECVCLALSDDGFATSDICEA